MTHFEFMLTFSLPDPVASPEEFLDALFEAGCDDASVGVGQYGMIGLDFTRAAVSADAALRSAIENVRTAIPGARLAQAGPDLVGLTDMAEIFGFSRQNMRKYATGQSSAQAMFPAPVFLGEPSLWHLAEIVAWLGRHTLVTPPGGMLEVSRAAALINFEIERERLGRIVELT